MKCQTPKKIPVLSPDNSGEVFEIYVPCDKCCACQSRKRAEMVLRAFYENKSGHTISSHFITLTYDNSHLPCDYLDATETKLAIDEQMLKAPQHRDWSFANLDGDHISKFLRNFQKLCKKIGLSQIPDFLACESIKSNRNARYILTGEY